MSAPAGPTVPGSAWDRVMVALEAHGLLVTTRGDHAEFRCPLPGHSHDDKKPSGTADRGDRGALLRCHAYPEQHTATDIAAAIDLRAADLFDGPPLADGRRAARPARPRPSYLKVAPEPAGPACSHQWVKVAEYPYADADGELINRVARKECRRCGGKDIRPVKPWPGKPGDRPLYRLPEVLAAIPERRPVYVVEGEKDADALRQLGLCATTNPFGAGKWLPEHTDALRGAAHVLAVADKDAPGYGHAAAIAAAVADVAERVDVLEAAHGKDVSDHLAAGGTPETLVPIDPAARLAELTGETAAAGPAAKPPAPERPVLTPPRGQRIPVDPLTLPSRLSLLEARRLDPGEWPHVVPELLPVGLVLIYGRPGVAKTTLSAQLEHLVAAGKPVAGYTPESPGRCLIIDFEGGPLLAIGQSIRIASFGTLPTDDDGDPDELITLCTQWPGLTFGERYAELDKALRDASHDGRPYQFVRIDTLRAFMGPPPLGVNAYQYDADCLIKLNALARELHVCILVIHHPNKAGEVSGSVGIEGSVTAAYKLERKPGESEGLLRCTKNRVGPERSWPVEFDQRAGTWAFSDEIVAAQAATTGHKRRIIDYLLEHGPSTGPEIRAGVPDVKETVLKNAMTRLGHEGWIERRGDGVWILAAVAAPDPPAAAEQPAEPDPGTWRDRVGQCAVCGTAMTIVEPGQTTHPCCDPDPDPGSATAPDPADVAERQDDEAAGTCQVCGEPRTVADQHPDCEQDEAASARWPAMRQLREAFSQSRMKPIPWIAPPDHPKAESVGQTRDMPAWQLAERGDVGAFAWRNPGLAGFDPDRLVLTIDRNGSFVSACSSVPVAPNVLLPYGPFTGSPRDLGKPDPRTGEPTGLAGVVAIVVPAWEHGELPHPLGRNARPGEHLVIPSGTLEDLLRLHGRGLIDVPQVVDSALGRRNASLFEPFYKDVKAAREQYAADPVMLAAVKRSSSVALRLLFPKAAQSPWFRPDWYAAIVGQSMIRHWINAWRAVTEHGAILAALGSTDEAAFIVPADADPDTYLPEPYKLGSGFGQVKAKPVRVRADVDLTGIDPARITPAANHPGQVMISGPVPLRVWRQRRG